MDKLNKIEGHRLFTYKVAHDGGSAPNPYHGICTLAICKPAIRRVAKPSDLIVGLGCGKDESRIIYCMVVDHAVSWGGYIKACKSGLLSDVQNTKYEALKKKIPKNDKDPGDCIWTDSVIDDNPLDSWSNHDKHDFNRDVKNGENVLIGEKYWYFGKGNKYTIHLPDDLKKIIPGRGHRSNSNHEFHEQFVRFFNEKLAKLNITTSGVYGAPAIEPDKTDNQTCSRCRAEERESDDFDEEL